MNETKLPIWQTALATWRDGLAAIRDMPVIAASAYAIGCLVALAGVFLDNETLVGRFLNTGAGILQIFFLTPVAIAIHRYVLLQEVTQRYRIEPTTEQFKNFFGIGVVIQIAMEVPLYLYAGHVLNIGGLIGLFVIAILLMVRTLIIFPAIAVDAPRANWWSAIEDSKGHFWRIAAIGILVTLPLLLLSAPIVVFVIQQQELPVPGAFLMAIISVGMVAAYAAMASHFYRAWARRLGRPDGLVSSV